MRSLKAALEGFAKSITTADEKKMKKRIQKAHDMMVEAGANEIPEAEILDALAARLARDGIETSDQWIVERTGIRARHFAAPDVASSDLALHAARHALDPGITWGSWHVPVFFEVGVIIVLSVLILGKGGAEGINLQPFDPGQSPSGISGIALGLVFGQRRPGGLVADGSRGFAGGRAVRIDAERGADTLRSIAAQDDGASFLGELALVDGEGRIGPLGTVFYNTLLDENAASHIALGNAYRDAVDESEWDNINDSQIHIDFMIGSDDVAVTGHGADGRAIPLLRDGHWQI